MKAFLKKEAFTLIEIIVVIAIVAIMAGIMIPMIYKVWESNEIELTRQRMSDLSKAITGDPKMIQNGVRMYYGYAGDIGQLPASLTDLISAPAGVANWNGAYLPSGFNPNDYRTDAWGNTIIYTTAVDASNRRVSAVLTSYGSDGLPGNSGGIPTAEDIVIQISSTEVIPTDNVQGTINITFNSPPQVVLNYSARVLARYRDGLGSYITGTSATCIPVTIGGSSGNTAVNYSVAFNSTMAEKLPVGTVFLWAGLFSDNLCINPVLTQTSSELQANVNDRVSSIFANLRVFIQ